MLRAGATEMRFLTVLLMLGALLSATTLLLIRSFAAGPSEASLEHLYTRVLSIQEVRRPKSGKLLMIEFADLGMVRYSDEWSKYSELKASLLPGQEVDIWFDSHWSEYDPVYRIETASHVVLLSAAEMRENIAHDRWWDSLIAGALCLAFGALLAHTVLRRRAAARAADSQSRA